MQLFDTLAQVLTPVEGDAGVVRMYVCGITPYDASHMGHARVAVVFDALRRTLEWTGLRVRYVQNITDIDDPLFERARRDGIHWRDLGDRQTARYLAALAEIHVPRPEIYIKATDEIPAMLPVIARLIALGHGYVSEGAVFYDVTTDPGFGAICHCDEATMLATATEMGNDPADPRKRHPLDFVLWQPSGADEPGWENPWGPPGRPGWHIECSTIAMRHLGPQLDIHGGGADLIFPHHACEIAQAEPVTGVRPFVRAWVHVGLVTLGGIKMSKSLGNMVFVRDVLAHYSANALRLALLSKPYRSEYEYSNDDVRQAGDWVEQIVDALEQLSGHAGGAGVPGLDYRERFQRALDNDLDTPAAIAILLELAGLINMGADAGRDVSGGQAVLSELSGVLGLVV